MDGASKFVRGDAIAGIIILHINLLGGLVIGVTQHGLSLAEAARIYMLLTVGDGLVSQIPALIVSTAAGLIVTRAASESNLSSTIAQQLTRHANALAIASALLIIMGVMPGMPLIPFWMDVGCRQVNKAYFRIIGFEFIEATFGFRDKE